MYLNYLKIIKKSVYMKNRLFFSLVVLFFFFYSVLSSFKPYQENLDFFRDFLSQRIDVNREENMKKFFENTNVCANHFKEFSENAKSNFINYDFDRFANYFADLYRLMVDSEKSHYPYFDSSVTETLSGGFLGTRYLLKYTMSEDQRNRLFTSAGFSDEECAWWNKLIDYK